MTLSTMYDYYRTSIDPIFEGASNEPIEVDATTSHEEDMRAHEERMREVNEQYVEMMSIRMGFNSNWKPPIKDSPKEIKELNKQCLKERYEQK